MRGTQTSGRNLWNGGRIIPAYAGNTANTLINGASARDHPRVCGEHILLMQSINGQTGSSPRMRGTHLLGFVCDYGSGIIPAYAGNTRYVLHRLVSAWDHPRVCGEHARMAILHVTWTGSSPRMRGTRTRIFDSCEKTGIIPAYAGNTNRSAVCVRQRRDHPRVCGEHLRSAGSLSP